MRMNLSIMTSSGQVSVTILLSGRYRVFIRYCVFLEDVKIFRTLAFLCFPSVSVFVHIPGIRTHALQQNWQSSEKSQKLKEKHNI